MTLIEIKQKVAECLKTLYREDAILLQRNKSRGLCERCLVFRFAMYLQQTFPNYSVDCDFNSSSSFTQQSPSEYTVEPDVCGKPIANPDGTTTKRFIDIIIHQRSFCPENDFICFEVKKWTNNRSTDIEKDRNNLRCLTTEYRYRYGFLLILGKTLEQTKWQVFSRCGEPGDLELVCGHWKNL